MFFQPPALSLGPARPRPGSEDGLTTAPVDRGLGGSIPGCWEQIKGPGQSTTPRGARLGGAGPGWLRRCRMPHGMGSAAPASRHPAGLPRHLRNKPAEISPGQERGPTPRRKLERELSPSEPPLVVGPCEGGIGAQITGQMGRGAGADTGHAVPATLRASRALSSLSAGTGRDKPAPCSPRGEQRQPQLSEGSTKSPPL